MALSLDFVTPEKSIARGSLISVVGDFSEHVGKKFRAYVGPSGDDSDHLCLSGRPGAPHTIYPLNTYTIRFYLPDIEAGGPYNIFIQREDETAEALLAAVLTIVKSPYQSGVFAIRGLLPNYYKAGPRSMALLERIP